MKASRIISYLLAVPLSALTLSGCNLFGLELQKKYDYDHSVAYSNQLDVNGWDFLQKHATSFPHFLAAIEYAGIDHEIFNQPGITIFPIMNAGITSLPSTGANGGAGGYWNHHPINNGSIVLVPESWDAYEPAQVKEFVLNHIVKHAISYGEFLSMVPNGQRTFFETMANDVRPGYGYMSFHMLNFTEAPNGGERITRLYINDFPSHFRKPNTSTDWDQLYFYPRTSNLRTLNGSYIHIMEKMYLDFPTDEDLASTPVWGKK
jgi:hypothetical protein